MISAISFIITFIIGIAVIYQVRKRQRYKHLEQMHPYIDAELAHMDVVLDGIDPNWRNRRPEVKK